MLHAQELVTSLSQRRIGIESDKHSRSGQQRHPASSPRQLYDATLDATEQLARTASGPTWTNTLHMNTFHNMNTSFLLYFINHSI